MDKKIEVSESYDILTMFKKDYQSLTDRFSTEYENQRQDLMFESGIQYQGDENKERSDNGRKCFVFNKVRPMVDRVTNPYLLNPVEIKLQSDNDILDDTLEIVQAQLNKIERNSDAHEAYQTGLRNQVSCGRGFIYVGTEYEGDKTLDQKIVINQVINPQLAFVDGNDINGFDSSLGVIVEFIPLSEYKREYKSKEELDCADIDVWGVAVPDGFKARAKYFKKVSHKVERYFFIDGSFKDNLDMKELSPEEIELVASIRVIEIPQVKCFEITGNVVVSETMLDIPYIPIIPVLGDRTRTESDKYEYTGIVNKVRDSQKLVNLFGSNEAEVACLAPVAPYLVDERQVGQYGEVWNNLNKKIISMLPYRSIDENGRPVPPPQRQDMTNNTSNLLQSKQSAKSDMNDETGIYESMMGNYDARGVESGTAITTRNVQGEIATANYVDNLNKSLKQVARVIVSLMKVVYDTEKTISVDGNEIKVNFSELLSSIDLDDIDYKIVGGETTASKTEKSINQLMMLAQITPESAPLIAVKIVENSNIKGKEELAETMRKNLPPQFQDEEENAPDPKAIEALEIANVTIDELTQQVEYMKGVLGRYQQEFNNDEKNRQVDLAKAEIKSIESVTAASIKAESNERIAKIKEEQLVPIESDTKTIAMTGLGAIESITTETVEETEFEEDFVNGDSIEMSPLAGSQMIK